MTRIDEIRARLAAATPRPWPRESGQDGWRCVGPVWVGSTRPGARADADLVANSPDDLAFLFAEVERLRAEAPAERAATVVYLRALARSARGARPEELLADAADEIKRGAHTT